MIIICSIMFVGCTTLSILAYLKARQIQKAIFEIIAPDIEQQRQEILKIKKKL